MSIGKDVIKQCLISKQATSATIPTNAINIFFMCVYEIYLPRPESEVSTFPNSPTILT